MGPIERSATFSMCPQLNASSLPPSLPSRPGLPPAAGPSHRRSSYSYRAAANRAGPRRAGQSHHCCTHHTTTPCSLATIPHSMPALLGSYCLYLEPTLSAPDPLHPSCLHASNRSMRMHIPILMCTKQILALWSTGPQIVIILPVFSPSSLQITQSENMCTPSVPEYSMDGCDRR